MTAISEKDWKTFKRVKEKALNRLCQSVLDETTQLCIQSGKTSHERYLEVHNLIRERNKTIGRAFDGHSRSNAMLQLGQFRQLGLADEENMATFAPDVVYEIQYLSTGC